MVAFRRSCRPRSSAHISSRNSESSAPSGSSIMKASGWRTIARPSATRCRSPLERPDTGLSSRRVICRMRAASSTLRSISAPRHALRDQRKGDVPAHVHVRIEREQLEHEGDVALRGALPGDVLAAEEDPALGRQLEAGDHAQGRRLAAARRAEQAEEFAVLHGEGRVLHRHEVGKGLVQALDADLGHRRLPPQAETWRRS